MGEKIEREFVHHDYYEHKKVRLAVQEFSGYAATWWDQFVLSRKRCGDRLIETWAELKTNMRKQFVPRR